MLIDWFTVVAQAINFLVLVWLLKRFLYKPILHAIDEREKRIATELADADLIKSEAQRERDEFRLKNENLDQQSAAFLARATDEANTERRRLMDQARLDSDALRAKQQEALKREQQGLSDEIIRLTQDEVFEITRKTLSDLAGVSLEDRMCVTFNRRLQELNDNGKIDLKKALQSSSQPAIVRSAFELSPQQCDKIQSAIHRAFSVDIPVRFETSPDVISGIELTANGRKIAWSIADYLESLATSVRELLHDPSNVADTPQVDIGSLSSIGKPSTDDEAVR